MTQDATGAWGDAINLLVRTGQRVAPRGNPTIEMPHHTVVVDMRRPVLDLPERKLSYRFMAAEAYWILSGDNTVQGIAPWNKHIAAYSDDGETFAGAYGPQIVKQLPYVIRTLVTDQSTRQAGLTIWQPNPKPSKDIPCTVAIFFQLRDDKLNLHVYMRSSDVWLGLPYDIFNFSMLAHMVCGAMRHHDLTPSPGTLYLTAASMHLYESNLGQVAAVIDAVHQRRTQIMCGRGPKVLMTPNLVYMDTAILMDTLELLRDSRPGDPIRWWESEVRDADQPS